MKKKRDRRIVTFCATLGLAAMLAMSVPPCQAAAKQTDVTQAEPVQTELDRRGDADLVINNADGMKAFVDSVNKGNDYKGKLVVLGADIVFNQKYKNYTPASVFSGTFDGQGHSISGIWVADTQMAAIFSRSNGLIQNVTVKGCQIVSNGDAAGLVGYNYGTINNCTIDDVYFTSDRNIGGVVAMNNGIINNCAVNNPCIKGINILGGIAAQNGQEGSEGAQKATIRNCYVNDGLVAEGRDMGGIVGHNFGDIYNCANNCEIDSVLDVIVPISLDYKCMGGIAGVSGTGGNIENCYNSGTLDSPDVADHIGGIAGEVQGGNIYRCYTLDTAARENFGAISITPLECSKYSAEYMRSQAFADQLNQNRGTHSDWRLWEIRSSESPYPLLKMPVNLDKCVIAPIAKCVYNGKAQTPDVEITYNGYKLVKDVDYTLKYADNVKIGTATVEISGKENFTGTVKRNFLIEKPEQTFKYTASYVKAFAKGGFDLNVKRIKGKGALTYTSSNKKVVTVDKKGHVTMKNIGKAQITVKAAETEDYKATSVEISITVKPAKVKLTSVQVKGGRIIAKWNMASHVKGYQIQYSTSKKFKSGVKQAKIKKKTKVSYKSKKIKKGKTYYVRVRAYKGNLYGAWSKKVKIKG